MESLHAIGSSPHPQQARSLANLDAELDQYAFGAAASEANPFLALDDPKPRDPATEQQRTLHFISHINAECFISLLQTMDPMPHDHMAQAEYRRFYRQLHDTLEVPRRP